MPVLLGILPACLVPCARGLRAHDAPHMRARSPRACWARGVSADGGPTDTRINNNLPPLNKVLLYPGRVGGSCPTHEIIGLMQKGLVRML